MDRDALADFLKRRRLELQPGDVGLSVAARRRIRGLRREEVALLASMSADFYARLEQRRGSRPSEQTVAALAGALQLTKDERDHLFELAGHTAPRRALRPDHASPELKRILDLLAAPAIIISDLCVILSQNALAVALLGQQTEHAGLRRSMIYRWFTDPVERQIHPLEDHPRQSRIYVAALRAVHGRSNDDVEARELVEHLLCESDEFAALWQRHEVANLIAMRKRFLHPVVGLLNLDCQVLTAENQTERLVVFAAPTGSDDAIRLGLLRSRPAVLATGSRR
jgi:transcriptional regulator with XRE-family HTH domain